MRRVGPAWAVAVAIVALVAPFAAAVPAVAAPRAPASIVSDASATPRAPAVPASIAAPRLPMAPVVAAPAAAPAAPQAVPSEDVPGGTKDGSAFADPDDGAGFDLEITASPGVVGQGGIVDVSFTITDHDQTAPEAGAMLLVALSWNTTQFQPILDPASDVEWAYRLPASEYYRHDTTGPRNSGDVCILGGMAPGTTGTCSSQFRHVAGQAGATSQFTAEIITWADLEEVEGSADNYEPLATDASVLTSVSAAVEAEPVFELTVANYDHLGIAAVGAPGPVLGRYAVYSTELALRRFDDAELVVRLSWPQGMTLNGAPPAGCLAVGTSALDCTIDDANLLPGLPVPPVPEDDAYPRLLREWDLHFTPPAWQVERERLDAFAIGFTSGWTFIEPEINLASWAGDGAAAHGAAATGRVATSRTTGPIRGTAVPAATPTPPGGVAMTPAWASPDSVPYAILDQVFDTSTQLDAEYLTSGVDDRVTAVFTVTHHPDVTTVLTDSRVAVQLDWPDFVEPIDGPDECASFVDRVCTLVGLDEPGASIAITIEFAVGPGPDAGRITLSPSSVIIVESNSDGDIEHAYPERWISYSSDRLAVDDALVSLDVLLSDDAVWEDGPMLSARVIPTRAPRPIDDDGTPSDRWDWLIVEFAITWPEYLTLMSVPSGCSLEPEAMVCELVLEEPGPDPSGIWLAFSVGPGVTDGVVTADGVSLRNFDGEETDELPVGWVVPDEEPLGGVAPFISLDVEAERDLVWEGGEDLGATITATRAVFPNVRRDPFEELAVEVEITWPAFLQPTGDPTGCESWDGTVCVIVLPEPGAVVVIGLEFAVGGDPPGGVVTGEIDADATRLVHRSSDGDQDLPTEWVSSDDDAVTRIRATVGLDLSLDRDPGYTGGKQLVVTTKVSREQPGPELPGLEVGLDFGWAGYLTRTAQTGCASFSGTTCVVTGLDEPGASAVVTLTFSMPAPTLPPVPEVAPRTDDVEVDGVSLSFAPPPLEPPSAPPGPEPEPWPPAGCFIVDGGICVCSDETVACPEEPAAPEEPAPAPEPEPLDGTLPPTWIGQDREAFTVLQPSIIIAQSVASPGDGVEAYARYLPPDARITLRWEGLATMAATQWPNPDDPTQGRWSLVILRWQFAGARTLIMHSEDGLFADVPSSNRLLVVPRSAMGPSLVGRGG